MSDEKPHPIALEALVFTRCSVVAVPGHVPVPGRAHPGPENSIQVTKMEDRKGRYQTTMRTLLNQSGDKAYPYIIDMECLAEFQTDDTLTDEEALRGVYITSHSVMFGAIRESVSWITGRQPYGGLLLGLSVLKNSAAPVDESATKKD